jgi:hypothetical protein
MHKKASFEAFLLAKFFAYKKIYPERRMDIGLQSILSDIVI